MKSLITALTLSLCLVAANTATAALVDRGGGLIFDTDLNVTWLQDAKYIQTSGYVAVADNISWSQATTWAANLSYYDSVRNVTYDDWRLPTTGPVNGTAFNYNNGDQSFDGSTDVGYNISAPGSVYPGSKGSELAYLYHNSLNNKGYCDPALVTTSSCGGVQTGWGLTNTGPFINLQSDQYWSATEYAPDTNRAWSFGFNYGFQLTGAKNEGGFHAWAVRSGDVAAASVVPIPAAFWLFGSGVIGLFGFMRRRHNMVN